MVRPPAILLLLALTAGATPATAPSTRPATTTPAPLPVERWFAELADADPAVRAAAFDGLMGLPASALPRLQAAVRASRPLAPAQAGVMYEIVRQVYLADQDYASEGEGGDDTHYIMGQDWPPLPWRSLYVERLGVPVARRWPGFPAGRYLRDGDMVLGVYASATPPADRPPDRPTQTPSELVDAMRACPTMPHLALSVLRDGRPIQIQATTVIEPSRTVNRRPAELAAFLNERQQSADQYWQAEFAPWVEAPPIVRSLDD